MKKLIVLLLLSTGLLFAEDQREAFVKDLEQSLIAPCCWSGTVYDHGHAQMETEIRQLADRGMEKKEILDYFVAQYGERILASPAATGFNLMAWITPVIILLVGLAVLINFLRSSKTTATASASRKNSNVPNDDVIERELKSLD